MERRLAVIFAADAVGYSHLMEIDEEATHRTLQACRSAIASLIAKHHGRIFSTAGDAVMAEFGSPIEAVRAAVEIQHDLPERSLDLPEGQRMQFRIGINLGDVIVEGGDLYGEGVNLAARLEGLADPGGICISANVHQHVDQKLPLDFRDIGEQTVKNIAKPVRVYRVAMREVDQALLSVTSVETFAANWLAPRLFAFQATHPNVTVRLEAMGRVVDLAREGFDIGIRSGRGEWPGLVAHQLFPIEFTPMCSPELMARVGRLAAPADLLRLPLLDDREGWWHQWFGLTGIKEITLTHVPAVQFITQAMLAQAVTANQGVALLVPALFSQDIAAGRLIQPFDVTCRSELSYWLVYPENRQHLAKIRTFKDWILRQVQGGNPTSALAGAAPA